MTGTAASVDWNQVGDQPGSKWWDNMIPDSIT